MKYVIFTKLNFNHFLFLLFFIINTIYSYVSRFLYFTKDIAVNFHKKYLSTFSDFLSIIPVLIIKIRSKSQKINDNKEKILKILRLKKI